MRILLKGTKSQIEEACEIICRPIMLRRNRSMMTDLAEARQKRESNRMESETVRMAFKLCKCGNGPAHLLDRFARAIYGERSAEILLLARSVIDNHTRTAAHD